MKITMELVSLLGFSLDWRSIIIVIPSILLVVSCFLESHDPLRFYAKYFLYIVYSSIISILMLPYILITPRQVKNCTDASIFLRYYTKLLGIEWDIRGTEELAKERGCVIVANHQSILDVLGMFNMWHIMGKCAAVARNELFYVIPFGPMAWLAGVVFIKRDNGKKSMQTLSETGDLVKNFATKLFVFPEGTRNKDVLENGLQPFKKGAFRIAIENQVPLLPIVYSPYYFIDGKSCFFGHGKMIIKTLKAIPTKGLEMKDIDQLIEKTTSLMRKELASMTREVLSTLPENYPVSVARRQQFYKTLQS